MNDSWIDGFNKAVARYLALNDSTEDYSTMETVYSPLSKHIADGCPIGEVSNVSQSVESKPFFDTFDANLTYPVSYISAEISCSCGKFTKIEVIKEAVLDDIIMGVANAAS